MPSDKPQLTSNPVERRLRLFAMRWTDSSPEGLLAREAAEEVERLRERVEILEAEIRVMKKLPAAVEAAMRDKTRM